MKKGKTKGFTPFETPLCAEIPFCISPNSTNNHCKGQAETRTKQNAIRFVVYAIRARARRARTHGDNWPLCSSLHIVLSSWFFGCSGLLGFLM